jgi:hypothetical protein
MATDPSASDGDIMTVKECIKELFRENGGHKWVMAKLGVGQSRAYGFTDERSDEQISFARVVQLTSPTAPAAARYLCKFAGGVFVPVTPAHADGAMSLTAKSVKETGDAISEALKALKDGKITPAERKNVIKEIREAISTLAALEGAFLVEEGK